MKQNLLAVALLTLIGLVLFGYGIGKRDLWAPDEPRFGQIAREMLQRMHSPDPHVRESAPFVLYVNNEGYSDKPPLYMWIVAAVHGGDGRAIPDQTARFNRAARIPSVFGAIIGLWAVYLLGLSLFKSSRTALISSLVLATTMMYDWQAVRAQLDMLMSGWSYMAMLGLWMGWQSRGVRTRIAWFALFWVMGALGTLSKGPPGLIVPLGSYAFFLMWQIDPRRTLLTGIVFTLAIFLATYLSTFAFMQGAHLIVMACLLVLFLIGWSVVAWMVPAYGKSKSRFLAQLGLFLAGLLLCAAIVAVWFVPYNQNSPKDANNTALAQTIERYLNADAHVKWIGFYLENLPASVLPWTLFFVAAAFVAYREKAGMPLDARRFLSSWILFPLVFFSLSPGKRDQYMLPCIPAFALFCGWFFDLGLRSGAATLGRWLTIPAFVSASIAASGSIMLFAVQFIFNAPCPELKGWRASLAGKWQISTLDLSHTGLWFAGLVLAALAVVLFISASRRRIWGTVIGTFLVMSTILVLLNAAVYPAINPRKTGRLISDTIMTQRDKPDAPVMIYDLFRAEYILYGDFFMKEAKESPETHDAELRAFLKQPRQAFVIMRTSQWRKVQDRYPDLGARLVLKQTVGDRGLVIIDNRAGQPLKQVEPK